MPTGGTWAARTNSSTRGWTSTSTTTGRAKNSAAVIKRPPTGASVLLRSAGTNQDGAFAATRLNLFGLATTFAARKERTLADAEREHIRLILEDTDGDIQRAAEILGISRKNLWEKRKKYGLLPSPTDVESGS